MENLKILNFEDSYLDDVTALWNQACADEMPYKPFTHESFSATFLKNPDFDYKGTFVALEDGKVVGFANGIYKKELLPGQTFDNTPGYITFVLVAKACRQKGIGSELLKHVEDYLKGSGKKFLSIIFFNPINLKWYIPHTDKHDHPNSPGVDIGSYAFPFFVRRGYRLTTVENSMHLDLSNFELTPKAVARLKGLQDEGIAIELYDGAKHHGFDEFFDHLKNEYWRKDIADNLALKQPRPILIASDRGKICGYAGPIAVEESGRGWFAGIGVDPAYEGRGIGTMLFIMLMKNFRDIGARFSTLFTGIENPAQKIYLRAGFKVVKQWATMRKEIV